jgi:predicted nucleotidyltransferase
MEPIYDKHPSQPHLDYKMMTWDLFLTIREWAQEVANIEGYPVYLVGSTLRKIYPRDIDIAIILPVEVFEERYGKIPDSKEDLDKYLSHPNKVWSDKNPYWATLQERVRWITRIDVKIAPDTWHTQQDKLLLAVPNGYVFLRNWKMLTKSK